MALRPSKGKPGQGGGLSGMAARVKQKAQEAEFSGGTNTLKLKEGVTFFKPEKGDKNEIIIVPFTVSGPNMEDIPAGEMWYRMQVLEHYNIGPEGKAVTCPRTIGKRCPICELRADLMAQGKDTKHPEVHALRTSKRDIFNVYDLNDEKAGIKIWKMSYYNFGELLEEEVRAADDTSHKPYFADPDQGSMLTIRFKEATMGDRKFLEASRIDFDQLSDPMGDLVDEALPLDEMVIILTYDELRRMLYDLDGDESTDEGEEQEAPAEKQTSRFSRKPAASGRKPAKDPEPEDEGEEGEDEQEETPPPSRKPAGKAPARRPAREPEPDPEEGEDGEEEPEDEPAPPTRKPAASSAHKPAGRKPAPEPEPEEGEDGEDVGEGECPGGGTWGTEDCDQLDACETCDNWSECRDAADALIKQAAKKPAAKTNTKPAAKESGTSRPTRRPR